MTYPKKEKKREYNERPWGNYYRVFQESGVWVKRVEVNVGGRISLQRHRKRSEKWIVVAGIGLAVVEEAEIKVGPGAVVDVPVGCTHRIGNTGQEPLVFVEVACGNYLAEDDIERIQDDYSR